MVRCSIGEAALFKKFFAGSGTRKSRLHDERGNLVSLSRLVRNGPPALITGIARLVLNRRPVRPWISYDAQKVLEALLTPSSRVLEFGSGMSTVWYAQHAGEVVSLEDYQPWYKVVQQIIAARGVGNIRYRFAANADEYTILTEAERGPGFDLIMIDGSVRDLCASRSIDLLRSGGSIYLDNSDKGIDAKTGNCARAAEMLLEYADRHGYAVRWFTDFAPTQLFVQQGLLVSPK